MTSGLGRFLRDPELERALDRQLADVEELLGDSVKSDDAFIASTARHLVVAGGKRFRPMLTLLAANLGDPESESVRQAAVVVELTHLATLYHDDVMDEASRRRGTDSANARWDNSVAILTGDFLFARSSALLADLGPLAVRIQAETFERLVMGQIHETVGPEADEDPVEHHLQVLADKTGSLIATSGRYGSIFGGCDDATIEMMTQYGERIGVAFQIADDLVDLVSDSKLSGKTQGTDLREGIKTLPALLALRDPNTPDDIRDLLSRPLPDEADHEQALHWILQSDALQQARTVAADWAQQARDSVEGLPAGPVKDALFALADYVVDRHT